MKKLLLLIGLIICILSYTKITNAYSKTFDEYIQLGKPINDLFNKPFTDYFYTCYQKTNILSDLLSALEEIRTLGTSNYSGKCGSFLGNQYKQLIKELKKITGYKKITPEIYSTLEKKSRNGTLQDYIATLVKNNITKLEKTDDIQIIELHNTKNLKLPHESIRRRSR